MNLAGKYDKISAGILSGFCLPLLAALLYFLLAKGDPDLKEWLMRIAEADVATHMVSLSVLPNLLIFLLFNHFDMLKAARGVLGVTIFWAMVVFAIKIIL